LGFNNLWDLIFSTRFAIPLYSRSGFFTSDKSRIIALDDARLLPDFDVVVEVRVGIYTLPLFHHVKCFNRPIAYGHDIGRWYKSAFLAKPVYDAL